MNFPGGYAGWGSEESPPSAYGWNAPFGEERGGITERGFLGGGMDIGTPGIPSSRGIGPPGRGRGLSDRPSGIEARGFVPSEAGPRIPDRGFGSQERGLRLPGRGGAFGRGGGVPKRGVGPQGFPGGASRGGYDGYFSVFSPDWACWMTFGKHHINILKKVLLGEI